MEGESTYLVGKHIHNIRNKQQLLRARSLAQQCKHLVHSAGNQVAAHAEAAAKVLKILRVLDVNEIEREDVTGVEERGLNVDDIGLPLN